MKLKYLCDVDIDMEKNWQILLKMFSAMIKI